MAHRSSKVEVASLDRHVFLHLIGQRLRLVRREVAPHATVDDGPAVPFFLDGCEVHAVSEVAAIDLEIGPHGLDRAAPRVVLIRVVTEDRKNRNVRLWGYPVTDGGHVSVAARSRKSIEVWCLRRL
jgi:hypothetical protein